MSHKDDYYNRAKQQGYRARSAYKLKQLDETADLFSAGDTVVDLGAAPGGWLQVAAERVGTDGVVVGVDLQRIQALDDPDATVETIRGDMTDPETRDAIRDVLDADPGERPVDVVISDMAPNMSGEYNLDHARSVHLARQAFEVATELLDTGGDLAVKVFDGRDLLDLEADIEEEFEYVRQVRPDASRDASAELYLVAKGRLTAPVRPGDELEAEVVDTGAEGDGIVRIEGYTVFVPSTTEGETVRIRLEDVKPQFGFATVVED